MKGDINGIGMTELAPSAPLEHTVIEKTPLFVLIAHMVIPHTKLDRPAVQIAMHVRCSLYVDVFDSFDQYQGEPKKS